MIIEEEICQFILKKEKKVLSFKILFKTVFQFSQTLGFMIIMELVNPEVLGSFLGMIIFLEDDT